MNLVLNLCDLIHVLDFGMVIASGSPQQVRNDQAVVKAYLGSSEGSAADELVEELRPAEGLLSTDTKGLER
jgi:hypothetical protein